MRARVLPSENGKQMGAGFGASLGMETQADAMVQQVAAARMVLCGCSGPSTKLACSLQSTVTGSCPWSLEDSACCSKADLLLLWAAVPLPGKQRLQMAAARASGSDPWQGSAWSRTCQQLWPSPASAVCHHGSFILAFSSGTDRALLPAGCCCCRKHHSLDDRHGDADCWDGEHDTRPAPVLTVLARPYFGFISGQEALLSCQHAWPFSP